MKKTLLLLALLTAVLASCNHVDPEDEPTEKEKKMVGTEMTWTLDSVLVIYNYKTSRETSMMLHPEDGLEIWSYTFYPCTYKFSKDFCFVNEMTGETVWMADEYNKDYCKYIFTYEGEVYAGGYLCYYDDFFMFNGLKEGGWVDVMLREADTNWNVPVWTCAYNDLEDSDGNVLERYVEYYSRTK